MTTPGRATTLVHVSDLHFGRDVDLAQIGALEKGIPALEPTAIVVSGDLTQRSRHGELQAALGFTTRLAGIAPTLVIPGNHDVEWWRSPLDLMGTRSRHEKYRRYFGEDLSPHLALPDVVVASALSSHGVTWKSLTWKLWRDTAVKGHLPLAEVQRASAVLAEAPAGALRVLTLHHNVLRGDISRRMGLARWRTAQSRIAASGADLVLCGHDHQEGAGLLGDVVISTAGTHTPRTRGGRPSAFNVIRADRDAIAVQHHRWDRASSRFVPGEPTVFSRTRRAAPALAGPPARANPASVL